MLLFEGQENALAVFSPLGATVWATTMLASFSFKNWPVEPSRSFVLMLERGSAGSRPSTGGEAGGRPVRARRVVHLPQGIFGSDFRIEPKTRNTLQGRQRRGACGRRASAGPPAGECPPGHRNDRQQRLASFSFSSYPQRAECRRPRRGWPGRSHPDPHRSRRTDTRYGESCRGGRCSIGPADLFASMHAWSRGKKSRNAPR